MGDTESEDSLSRAGLPSKEECQRQLAEAAEMEKARLLDDTSKIADIELRRMLEGR